MTSFFQLIAKEQLYDDFVQAFNAGGQKLLLIQKNGQIFLIENKCGHFGLPLEKGAVLIENNQNIIICHAHGISFDLKTGKVVNRPWETCDPIKIINYAEQDGMIGFFH